jgi:dTDP-4-amino-4,6-dideoxygalactose transaminase
MTSSAPAIPYNNPKFGQQERVNLEEVLQSGHIYGNGTFTRKVEEQLQELTGVANVLLTNSCTSALEMAGLLMDISPGDEVIMPSWTFTSTANPFVLRKARPVFVDVTQDTLTLDIGKTEAAITTQTRAVVAVNYGGFGPDMMSLQSLCRKNNLVLIEDAAQGIGAFRNQQHYGSFGDFGCLSFHGTKNVVGGEAGALLIRDDKLMERAEILREKGTDRSSFIRGEVKKYTWQDVGSSYLPSEFAAAVLSAQLKSETDITSTRRQIWNDYNAGLKPLALEGKIRLANPDPTDAGNGHIFWLLTNDTQQRAQLQTFLSDAGIQALTHYVSLHDSPAGLRYARTSELCPITEAASHTLLRLPIWPGMTAEDVETVIAAVKLFFSSNQ